MMFSRLAFVALPLLAANFFQLASGKAQGVKTSAMLQTGSVAGSKAALEVERVVHAKPAEQQAFVLALVDVVKQGRNLTDTQMEIVNVLQRMWYDQILPEMQRGHEADAQLLGEHLAGLGTCDQELAQRHSEVSAIADEKSQLEDSQFRCDEGHAAMDSNASAMVAGFHTFIESATPPSIPIPDVRAASPDMDSYVSENLLWFEGFNRSYKEMEAEVVALQALLVAKGEVCTGARTTFEAKFCAWQSEIKQVTASYSACREAATGLYQATLTAAKSNAASRKVQYAAAFQIECYLKVLIAPGAASQSMLASCQNSDASTSALDVQEFPLPPANEQLLSGLGQVQGGNLDCDAVAAEVAAQVSAAATAAEAAAENGGMVSG
ncbi:unnamed protein product [Polarella glacialis]|uniref:Uncharacterized protein n=1 Tax=Polarella glacialis TaxID=89957 RepID=A0A813FMZ9_POLGL|nr:unnamed protein product [Polarella glacialis]